MGKNVFKIGKGFSLVELMVTLLVVSIIALFAIPGMGNLIDKIAVRSTKDSLVDAIRTARVTSVEQKTRLQVCGLATDGSCSSAAADWDRGVVIARENNDNSLTVLHQFQFRDSVFIKTSSANYTIYVNEQGWTVGSADSILICRKQGDNENGFRVVISRAGKVRYESWDPADPWKNSSGTALNC